MSSSDDEVGYEDEEEVAPHRPPVREGRVRICLAGRPRLCPQTGYAAKLIRAIVDENDSTYESWLYFERRKSVYNAFVDKIKRELNEDQRTKFSRRSVRPPCWNSRSHRRARSAGNSALSLIAAEWHPRCPTGLVIAFHLVRVPRWATGRKRWQRKVSQVGESDFR